jgi:hypothetical protein
MRKAGFLHNVGDGNIFHAVQPEHPGCGFDNELPILFNFFFS